MKNMRRAWQFLTLLPGLLGGCSSAELINGLIPRDDFRLVADESYGPAARQKLDLYLPVPASGPHPVVVFFYGGNWQTGSKDDYPFLGEALASRGFVVVIPDYRLYPEVRYPEFITDCADAVRWTLAHISQYGGDAGKVSLMGHSAGAYNALMLTLDRDFLGADRARIARTVGLAGPYDFLPLTDPALQAIFATEPDLAKTQPIYYADGTAPPVLLVTGKMDNTVFPRNTEHLAARIREKGGMVEERYYSLIGHVTLIGAMAAPLRFLAPVRSDVVEFLAAPTPAP
jgi:acetyl esterase/lipase